MAINKNTILAVLDKDLPPNYNDKTYYDKYDVGYYHIYENYYDAGKSVKKGFAKKHNFHSVYIPNLDVDYEFQTELDKYLKS